MNPVVVISQDGIEEALEKQRDFIFDPYLEEIELICYVQTGLTISLGSAKIVAKKLKNHQALKKISFDSHNLCAESARWICGSLATIKSLEDVSFITTFITPDAMPWIVELVKSKPKLKSLTIHDSNIFLHPKAIDLFTALEHSHLKELSIKSETLAKNEGTIDALANFLKRNNSLEKFEIGTVTRNVDAITDSGWAKIFNGIAENKSITSLKLYNLYITEEVAIKSLARMLRMHKNFTDLDLKGSYLSDEQIVPIIESIMANDSIEYLDLSANHVSVEGHKTLAKYLEHTNWLTHLNLSNGENRGLRYFWEGMKKNKTLVQLEAYYVSPETLHMSDAQQTLWHHPTILEFGCTGFYMENRHPLTDRLREHKLNIRNLRKEMAFTILMLAKSARKFPAEIWSLILHYIAIPSFDRPARADKLFDCIVRNSEEIFKRIERGDWFKIIQHKDKTFTFEEYQ